MVIPFVITHSLQVPSEFWLVEPSTDYDHDGLFFLICIIGWLRALEIHGLCRYVDQLRKKAAGYSDQPEV